MIWLAIRPKPFVSSSQCGWSIRRFVTTDTCACGAWTRQTSFLKWTTWQDAVKCGPQCTRTWCQIETEIRKSASRSFLKRWRCCVWGSPMKRSRYWTMPRSPLPGRTQWSLGGRWQRPSKPHFFQGEGGNADGIRDAAAARSLLKDSGLPHRLAFANVVIGRIQRAHGDTVCAITAFREALALAEECGSEWMQFHAAYELGAPAQKRLESGSVSTRGEDVGLALEPPGIRRPETGISRIDC